MWRTIAKKEIVQAYRFKLFMILAAITWLLLIAAGVCGYERYRHVQQQQGAANSLLRHEWEEQETNPHSAAHFGTWLFKPFTMLTLYDNGLNNFTGISYRVEAHKQHEMNYSTVQDTDSQLRFGELTVALVFQLLAPLLIIILAHSAVSSEKEHNTLRLLRVQAGGTAGLLWGKIWGNYAIILLILMPALLFIPAATWLSGDHKLVGRSLTFSAVYLLYFFLVTALTVLVSAWSRHSSGALLFCLGGWMLCCIVLPRMMANWADQSAPLPSRYAFNKKVQEGYSKGLGNDGTVMERRKRYEKQILTQYQVDTVTRLPVNFDGLVMQYGEEYQSMVYGTVAAATDSIVQRQQQWLETASLLDPFIAIQQVSMGLTGTDYYHHLSFHRQARQYRDQFIRTLNLELANNGGPYLSYDYKVGPAWFKKTRPFNWQLPSTGSAVTVHARAWAALAGWLILLVLLIFITERKLVY